MNNLKLTLRNSYKFKFYVLLAICIAVVIGTIMGLINFQKIRDWYILSSYKPPTIIQSLAREDTMTIYAKNLFYVNEPKLESKYSFAKNCPNSSSDAYVIGCYHSGDQGIFILNVQDRQLNGIVPVTAAYEMLHSAYARLNSLSKSKLKNEMWAFYRTHVNSPQIKQQMASYAATEPGAQSDELFSVLGTEVPNLSSYLVNQYKAYFTNRMKIVSMYEDYQAAFTTRLAQIKKDDIKLSTLKGQIKNIDNQINNLLISINSESQLLNNERAKGDYTAYNSGVSAYNNLVNQYNSLVNTVKIDINDYNGVVSNRNSLVLEEQQLVKAITSTPSKKLIK